MLCFSFNVLAMDNKDIVKKTKAANEFFEIGDYKKALDLYALILKSTPNNPIINYRAGLCILYLNQNKKSALPYFQTASESNIEDSWYYLGMMYHLNTDFEKAIVCFNQYKKQKGEKTFDLAEVDRQIQTVKTAKELIQNPKIVIIQNIGSVINTEYPEYVPLISADEEIMIFTSRRKGSTGGLLDPYGAYFEDVYISRKTNGEWSSPFSISDNINTPSHDACVALSADGENLIIYRTNEDLTGGDLYISKFDGLDWTKPEKLGPTINTSGLEPSASISSDNNTLYFSSNRPGGYGGKDIYKVVKLPNGEWSKAQNLGPMVNTPLDDDSPFIHPDGKTLYFSSKGHINMGGYDIFKSILDDNGEWSVPENLGSPINTVEDDIFFVMGVNGDVGYYSSTKDGGYGSADIYKITFPEDEFELQVLKGAILNNSDKKPISANITLIDEVLGTMQGTYTSNSLTGKFLMIVTPGRNYNLTIEAPGFETYKTVVKSGVNQKALEIILTSKE
jgi:hypothetical protein